MSEICPFLFELANTDISPFLIKYDVLRFRTLRLYKNATNKQIGFTGIYWIFKLQIL